MPWAAIGHHTRVVGEHKSFASSSNDGFTRLIDTFVGEDVNDGRLMTCDDLRQYKSKQVDQVDMEGVEVVGSILELGGC